MSLGRLDLPTKAALFTLRVPVIHLKTERCHDGTCCVTIQGIIQPTSLFPSHSHHQYLQTCSSLQLLFPPSYLHTEKRSNSGSGMTSMGMRLHSHRVLFSVTAFEGSVTVQSHGQSIAETPGPYTALYDMVPRWDHQVVPHYILPT